jgi:putative hemolysin
MRGGAMRGGAMRGGAVAVPQSQMLYTPSNGAGSQPNDQMKANAQTQSQGTANAQYDNKAYKGGRSKRSRSRRGGKWGCYSG